MKIAKFTFKKQPDSKGLTRIAETKFIDIKYKKHKIGLLRCPATGDKSGIWSASFYSCREPTELDKSDFKNVFLKKEFESLEEMKNFLNKNNEKLYNETNFYAIDEDRPLSEVLKD